MNIGHLRSMIADLNDQATVTVGVNGALFDLTGLSYENHDADRAPRIVLHLGPPYRYAQVTMLDRGRKGRV